MKRHYKISIVILIVLLSLLVSLCIGSNTYSPYDILKLIGMKFGGYNASSLTPIDASILISIRLPRVILAFGIGALLSISGAICQSLLQNPLASSYTLGVSSGCSLGASIIITSGITIPFVLPGVSFLFGFAIVLANILITNKMRIQSKNYSIILLGMTFSLLTNALMTFISTNGIDSQRRIIQWMMGSFSSRGIEIALPILLIAITGTLITTSFHKELDIFSFGDEVAATIGVNVRRSKTILLLLSTIFTSFAVCFTGVIGFVDLIIPHAVRKLLGPKHRSLIPYSAIIGGTFMCLVDTFSRTLLSPKEIPIGAMTALIGAPLFVIIFLRKGKRTNG